MNIEALTAPNPGPYTLDGTKSYVLDQHIIIDPGPPIERHVSALLAAAPGLDEILVTHRHADHAPAALRLKELTSARIHASSGTLPADLIDHFITDEERIDLRTTTLQAIASPGHTAEHFCFLSEDRQLFTGDTVLGSGTTVIFPPDGDMGAYFATLQRLLALEPAIIHPGHGPSRNDATALLGQYIEHRRMRERQILETLDTPRSIPEMRTLIYQELDQRLIAAAELQLEAHLLHLQARGEVNRRGTVYALSTQ